MDFVRLWSDKSEIAVGRFISWLGVSRSKFYQWRARYGKVHEHNGWVPRDYWLERWEKDAIIRFLHGHPLEGYRRLAFMMLDANVVAVSPTSVWRVLHTAGLLRPWNVKASKKGMGFVQPSAPMSTGMWTFRTSISMGRSTTCVRYWTAAAGQSCTGISGRR